MLHSTVTADLRGSVSVRAATNPFGVDKVDIQVPEGLTIAQIFAIVQPDPILRAHAHVFIGGHYIPQEHWTRVRPKAGVNISIRAFASPRGGGGNGSGKNILRSVLIIAVVAAAVFLGPAVGGLVAPAGFLGMSSAGVGQYLIGMVGMLAVNALVPAKSGKTDTAKDSQTLFIEGARNSADPFGPVPFPFGTHKMVPRLGARPYTEIVGDNQYLRMVFVWGIGPIAIDVDTLKIGETLLTEFDEVEIEHREGYPDDDPLTLYPGSVDQEQLSVILDQEEDYILRTASDDADELSVDLTFFGGLVEFQDDGDRVQATVNCQIQYSLTGVGAWTNIPTNGGARTFPDTWINDLSGGLFSSITFRGKKASAIRHCITWKVPTRGHYDVRIRRVTANSDENGQISDIVTWTALRRITNESPVNSPVPVAMTAIRIKATDQLNGILDEFSGVVTRVAKDWDSGTEVWVERETRSPAAAFRIALQGNALQSPLADNRIDLDGLAEWSEFCETIGFNYDTIQDYQSTVYETLSRIAAAGRATPRMKNGKWSVSIDMEKLPVGFVTPRNSSGFTLQKVFVDQPHFFRVRFPNENEDYRQDEHRIYLNGYTAENGTKSELLGLDGVTDPDAVAKHARFIAACGIHRAERWTFRQDFEYMTYDRGDRIKVTHDVLIVGKASGRIKSFETDPSGDVIGITVDEDLVIEEGNDYGVSIRTVGDVAVTARITNEPGTYRTVAFETPIAEADGIERGNLFGFGIFGFETDDGLVIKIDPQAGLRAMITCVPYREEVFAVDGDPIPPFDTRISPPITVTPPVASSIYNIGPGLDLFPKVGILVESPELANLILDVQLRPAETEQEYFNATIIQRIENGVIIGDIRIGETWDIRLRWRGGTIVPTSWTYYDDFEVVEVGPPAQLPSNSVTLDTLALILQGLVQQLDINSEASIARSLDEIHAHLERIAEANGTNFATIDRTTNEIIQAVGQSVGTAQATAVSALSAVATETAARASLTTLLEAIFGDTLATVNSTLIAASTDVLTTAIALTELFVSNGFGDAKALFRMVAESAPGGVGAVLALEARATSGDTFAVAGLKILAGVTALGGGSAIELHADRVVMKSSEGGTVIFEDGVWTSTDGLLVIDFNEPSITMDDGL